MESEESEMNYYTPKDDAETIRLLESGEWQVERYVFNDTAPAWQALTVAEVIAHAAKTGQKKQTAIVAQVKQGVLL